MAIAIVNGGAAHTHFETLNTGTSSAINTTGATIIIVHTSRYSGAGSGTLTLSDSKSNTWTGLTEQTDAEGSSRIYYCINPTVGSGHTFTATGTVIAASVAIAAFNGINPAYESENGTFNHTAPGSLATGARTPSVNGSLIISGFSAETAQTGTLSVSASLAITDQAAGSGGLNENGALAWFEQSTAASINPSWSWVGGATREAAATLAVFTPSASKSFSFVPTSGHATGTISLTMTGVGTAWAGSSPFSITAGGGFASLSGYSNISVTSATINLVLSSLGGTVTISDSDSATTQNYTAAAVAPGTPTIGTATNNHDGTVTVTFTPNADNGGATVTAANATGSLGDNGSSGGSSPITVNVAAGHLGSAQTWTVTTTNSAGTSSASGATGSITPTSPPGVPTAVSASVAGPTSATVTGTPPATTGGLSLTYIADDGLGGHTTSAGSLPRTLTGLTTGVTITPRLKAVNSDGSSAYVASGNSVTPTAVLSIVFDAPYVSSDTLPGTPTYQPYTIVGGVLTALGSAVTTGFNAVPNVTNGYRCVYQPTANGSFGDFAGIGAFTGINTTVTRAAALNSTATLPPTSNVTCEIAPFRPSDTLGTVVAQTLTISASTVGTGRTATAGAATFAGNSTDVGKYIYSGSGRAVITAPSSTTVCTVTIIDAFAGTSILASAWSWGSVGYINNTISGLTISQTGGLVTANIYAIAGIVNGFVALRSDTPDASYGSVVPADWQG